MIVEELCFKGSVEEFRNEVAIIVENIQKEGFSVSCWDNNYQSVTEWAENDDDMRVRIGMRDKSGCRLHAIWDLLHEYGHVLDGKPDSEEYSIEREITAWNNAQNEINKYPKLKPLISEFNQYKKHCLATYVINI